MLYHCVHNINNNEILTLIDTFGQCVDYTYKYKVKMNYKLNYKNKPKANNY